MSGYYPPSSYPYAHGGDAWRPPEADSAYDRSTHVPARRHSPSPARRYRSYSNYPPGENNYRTPYRSDEENTYYNQTPSPAPSRRESDPNVWSPWNSSRSTSWQESERIPNSPLHSTRFRNDNMLATRMHPPSTTWRTNRNNRAQRPDLNTGYADEYQAQDSDTYRPGYANDAYRTDDAYSSRGHYRRYSSPDSSSDPYARNGHNHIPHSPSVATYGREYAPPSPTVGAPYRHGYTPTQPASAAAYAPPSAPGTARQEYDPYRPGWSPTNSVNGRRRDSFPTSGRRIFSGQSPAHSDSSSGHQRRASFNRDHRWRAPLRTGSPTSPARDSMGRRRFSRSPDQSIKSSRSNSLSHRRVNRSKSPENRSRSRSPTSSKSNDDPSSARGRSPPRHSPVRGLTASGKAIWNRPEPSSGLAPKKSALNGLKTRSLSRSSIASSRPSEEATSIPAQKSAPPVWNTPVADDLGSTADPAQDPNGMLVDEAPVTRIETEIPSAAGEGSDMLLERNALEIQTPAEEDVHNPVPMLTKDESRLDSDTVQTTLGANIMASSSIAEPTDVQTARSNDVDPIPQSPEPPEPELEDTPMDVEPLPTDEHRHSALPDDGEIGTPYSIHTSSTTNSHVDEPIPDRSEAKSRAELLSIVVRTRLLCDRQTRQELVDPVIISNEMIACDTRVQSKYLTTPDELVKDVTDRYNCGAGPKNAAKSKSFLIERFKERETFLKEKTQRLRAEYLSLHAKWLDHCAELDKQNKVPMTETELALPTTRSSRRNAVLGDAVRSDLEMEQIIASLGIDDATDPAHLSLSNLAKIPDMISVTKGKVDYYYDDTNHLVENPAEYYGPQTGIHDWTPEEKEMFNAKFAAHPKQFGAIAEYLPNKTANQCVDYYYLHKKKLLDFRKIVARYGPNKRKRRGTGKNKRNALLADIRQHDAEVSRDNAASPAGRPGRGKRTPVLPPPDSKDKEAPKETRRVVSRRRFPALEANASVDSETPTPEPESKPRRGRRPATVVNVIPPPTPPPAPTPIPVVEPVISANPEEVEEVPSDAERPAKRVKRTRRIKSAAIVEEADTPEPESNPPPSELPESPSKQKPSSNSTWPEEDKKLFLTLLSQYGDNFERISASMPNKTSLQVSDYFSANSEELGLAAIVARAPKRSPKRSPSPPSQPKTPKTTVTAPTSPVLRLSPITSTITAPTSPTILRLAPDPAPAQTSPKPASPKEVTRPKPSAVSKPTAQESVPPPASSHPKERGTLPATAQYTYYGQFRHNPPVYHANYAQHRSALGPHVPSAVHAMPYVHGAPGIPPYPAHAHTHTYQAYHPPYTEVTYPAYNGSYTQRSTPETNGYRRLAPIRPREPYPYGNHAAPSTYHYHHAGK